MAGHRKRQSPKPGGAEHIRSTSDASLEGTLSERLATLDKARKMVAQIAEDTRTPADVIIKPQYLRNLCWTDEPQKRDVAQFLTEQGARAWQVALVAESVSRAIM